MDTTTIWMGGVVYRGIGAQQAPLSAILRFLTLRMKRGGEDINKLDP